MTYPKNWDGDFEKLATYTAEADRMDRAERRFDEAEDRRRWRAAHPWWTLALRVAGWLFAAAVVAPIIWWAVTQPD